MGRPKGSVNGVRLSNAERSRRYAAKNRAKLRKAALDRYYANHEENKERQLIKHRELRVRGVNVSGNRNRLVQPDGLASYASSLRWSKLYHECQEERVREFVCDSIDADMANHAVVWFGNGTSS